MGRALAVWGTSSGAGKSLLVTALARHFADQGLRVAPFKAQNMSLNARVVEGGEMAAAQFFQALAARTRPRVEMNPVLLKPLSDMKSAVILLGRPAEEFSRLPWPERKRRLWPYMREALDRLLSEYDLVLLEGAGSPAEVNLWPDYANLEAAAYARAKALLVADIDRGGAIAHLYGTVGLLGGEKERLLGFVFNKFRGDPRLLLPAYETLFRLTGLPVLGSLPHLPHALPEEDGLYRRPKGRGKRVAVVRYPYASNLDEFWPLYELSELRFAKSPEELEGAKLIILPGSRNVPRDLEFLRPFRKALLAHLERGLPLLALCGGAQMLGAWVEDEGIEEKGRHPGLGLLPFTTRLLPEKVQRSVRVRLPALEGPWRGLSGLEVEGYEIHHGQTEGMGLFHQEGGVLATYLHGLLENPSVQEALFGASVDLEATFDLLARAAREHLDLAQVERALFSASPFRERSRPAQSGRLVLVLGGAKSGKTRFALALAGERATYIATALALDEEMAERIARHKEERPPTVETLEEPLDLVQALGRASWERVVVDCLTLWVANLMERGLDPLEEGRKFMEAVRGSGKTVILVSNEVGLGLVPQTPLGRRYRDLLGSLHQLFAQGADEVYFLLAGLPQRLK